MTRLLLLLAFACEEDDKRRPHRGDDAPAGDDDDDDVEGDDDDDDAAPPGPDWSGAWEVEIEFSYTCDVFGDSRTNSGSGRWSLNLSGPPSDLVARVNGNDWYTMNGSGDDEGVFLCGSFPIPDLNDDAATSGNDNQLCIDAEQVIDAEEVRGQLTGSFEDTLGSCQMDSSPLVLTR
jgi:hypothetical protein